MTGRRLFVAVSIVALTLASYLQFPGHTFLESDTQIYIPILERFWDPTVFSREILALRPHVSFSIYDEAALLLRRVTGLDFRAVLTAEQWLFRALGILGVYLIATSFQLSARMALLAASTYSLGATILGPTVLTVEYEPVPRGFAVPLLLLATGLIAHGRDIAAGVAASLAFLCHAPTTYTFWAVYFGLTLWPTRPAVMSRRIAGLLPLLGAVLVLFVLSRMQPGVAEPQEFFSRLDPQIEQLQRWRAPYVWVSLWPKSCYWQYSLLWLLAVAGILRLRRLASDDLKFMLVGMPLLGAVSIPLSYVLLEKLKWTLIPQWQPARAVLFITALAGILAAVAGLRALQDKRPVEGLAWLAACYAIPASPYVKDVLIPNLADPVARRRAGVVLVLAVLAVIAAWAESRRQRWGVGAWAAALLAPLFLIPGYGNPVRHPRQEAPELCELTSWARSSTPKDAVFHFADAGRSLEPGIFRANSRRAVYVDWKGGGQVNFLKNLGEEWGQRWQATMTGKVGLRAEEYAVLGIDYVVMRHGRGLLSQTPVFSNSRYLVFRVTE